MENELQKKFNLYEQECRDIKRLRLQTTRGYRNVFNNFSRTMPEVSNMEDLSNEVMLTFFSRNNTRDRILNNGEKRTGVKESSAATYWSKLNSFFKWLELRYQIPNPLTGLPKPRKPEYTDKRALSTQEIERIIAAVANHTTNTLIFKRDTLIIYILSHCGLRLGELVGLKITDIDYDKKLLTVRGETSKSKKTRRIPISKQLKFHLEEYLKERKSRGYKTEWLLVSSQKDRGITIDGMKHWVKRYVEYSGVKFHLHRFRHSFAINLERRNMSATKIQKLMGHSDIKMTMSYLRSTSAEDFAEEMEDFSF